MHLYTVPDLLGNCKGWQDVLTRWKSHEKNLYPVGSLARRESLWLIVTGMDLLIDFCKIIAAQEACNSAAEEATKESGSKCDPNNSSGEALTEALEWSHVTEKIMEKVNLKYMTLLNIHIAV